MAIREIAFAAGAQADVFAAVEQGPQLHGPAQVAVWSVARRARLAGFPVAWDFGGSRLAVVAGGEPRIITAAYYEHGVSAYALDGARVWHRGDLKKVQHISPVFEDAEGRPALALGLERGSLVIVNPETGRTRSQVKGAKVLYAGPRGARLLRLKGAVRLEAGTPLQVHRVPLQSFSVLAASFSQEDVAFSEAGGNLRCYSLSGTPRWEANVGRGSKAHALEVAWNERHQLWLAVVSNFTAGGLWLVRIDARGEEVSRVPLAPLGPHCLAPSGDILGTGDGCVVEPLSNATLFRFLPEPAAPMRVVRKETP